MKEDQERPNWVLARASCTTKDVFKSLLETMSADVERFNRLSGSLRKDQKFIVDTHEAHVFRVYPAVESQPLGELVRRNDGPSGDFVRVECLGEHLVASRTGCGHTLIAVTWNEETLTCDLVLDSTPLAAWQVSQKLLGDFFFGA